MKLSEAKKRVLMLIDEYSTRGEINENGNIADYEKKLNSYFDLAQLNIAETKHIKRNFYISQYLPFTPSLSQFESVPHTNTDIIYSGTGYAYHFAVDGNADVVIEGVFADGTTVELDAIYAYSENGFTSYKGRLYYTENYSSIQIKFTGDEFYNIKDVAIFNAKYADDKVPNFSRYITYEMPKDFLKPLRINLRTKNDYVPFEEYIWENPNVLGISAFVNGEIRLEYAAKPKTIDDTTSDDYEFEINEFEQGAMLYYTAALCLQHANFNVYSTLMQQYTEKMINSDKRYLTQRTVKRVY